MGVTSDRIRVLHVDDNQEVADLAASYLQRKHDGFDVEVVEAVEAGLSRLRAEEFDCIVSDYEMPGRTGVEFLREVREQYPDVPFILFTGKGTEAVASDAISAGVTDYLQKGAGTGQYEVLANRIENAVQRAESQRAARHLRELADTTDRILYIFTHDWSELLFINSAYEEVWGRSTEALRENPRDFLDGVHPEDRDRVRDAMGRMSDGESLELEYRVNEAEDFDRWVAVRGEAIVDDGEVVRVAGFATEITERKALEQTLQTRTERLQEAQRVAGVGSWEWDAATDTVEWSRETYRIFGWNPDERGTPPFEDWLATVHPEDREHASAKVEEAMETGTFPAFDHRIERPDGTVVPVQCRGEVSETEDGTTRIRGTVLDVTDRETDR
ncbi:transcriptional regulator [Halobacteriales archaeon QS_1_69_70]|nr:MAG: transcriptional regulator [Halobacteriales archaeon QS_1_69_70]